MNTGTIIGGWGYVWAAYVITWAALGLYGVSLGLRLRKSAASSIVYPPISEADTVPPISQDTP